MIWKTIQVAVTTTLPKVIDNLMESLFKDEPPPDRTKYTKEQTDLMVQMWNNWQSDKTLYANQGKFAEAVNDRFSTTKSTATIIKHIRKSL